MRYQGTRYPLGVRHRSRRTSWLGKQQGMNMQRNCYYILAQLVVVLLFVISTSNHRSSRLDRWVYNSRDMINTQTAILLSDFRQHDWQLICSSVHSFVNNLDPHGTLRGGRGEARVVLEVRTRGSLSGFSTPAHREPNSIRKNFDLVM